MYPFLRHELVALQRTQYEGSKQAVRQSIEQIKITNTESTYCDKYKKKLGVGYLTIGHMSRHHEDRDK